MPGNAERRKDAPVCFHDGPCFHAPAALRYEVKAVDGVDVGQVATGLRGSALAAVTESGTLTVIAVNGSTLTFVEQDSSGAWSPVRTIAGVPGAALRGNVRKGAATPRLLAEEDHHA